MFAHRTPLVFIEIKQTSGTFVTDFVPTSIFSSIFLVFTADVAIWHGRKNTIK